MTGIERVRLSDGTSLHVERGGDPTAEVTVVFAHGYALDHRCWHSLTEDLPHAVDHPVQVITYDHRGHGRSGPGPPADCGRGARGPANLRDHAT